MKTKAFDCVRMKHQGAERIRSTVKDMTLEEEFAFWQACSKGLRKHQAKVTQQTLEHLSGASLGSLAQSLA